MKLISNHIVEAAALITAIGNYRYIKNTRYVYFIPYLTFILLGELGATYFYHPPNTSTFKNWHIYLLVFMVTHLFLGYQFYHILTSQKRKQITFVGTTILTLILSIVLFFVEEIGNLNNFTNVIAGLFFCYLSCFALYEQLIHTEDLEVRTHHSPDFWLVTGVLFFYAGTTLPYMLYFYLKKDNVFFYGMRLYHLIPRFSSIVLYNCYVVAIILLRRKALSTASKSNTAQ